MATYTSTVMSRPVKSHVYGGITFVRGSINLGATASSNGDVLFLAPIPHGAVVLELREDHTTGATTQALSFGMATGGTAGGGASLSAFIASGAQAAKNRLSVLGDCLTVSVSDSSAARYGILAAKVESGSATTSLIVNFVCGYSTDGTT